MVEGYTAPLIGGMAGGAVCSIQAVVLIVLSMAVNTVGRRTLENLVNVAFRAAYANMLPGQFECHRIMVKGGWFPGAGRMAAGAVCAQPARMRIILLVAARAACWCAFVDRAGMAVFAGNLLVFAGEWEGRP